MSENELLSRLPSLFRTDDPSVVLGTGPDDCAHVRLGGSDGILSISTDAFTEGSHFLPDTDARDIARKCLCASLSDLAASACRARWAVISLCLRPGLPPDWAGNFAEELSVTAKRYGVTIVGGDTISSRAALFVSVTVMGSPLPGGPVFRKGAKPGDVLVVTGELGGSLLGRHLNPVPRLREIATVMEFCSSLPNEPAFPSAAMDISDGLAIDLSRLCRESGVGAVIEEELLPISPQAYGMAEKSGRSPLAHALEDGEDFELLIAMPPRVWHDVERFLANGNGELAKFSRIGVITGDPALAIRKKGGALRSLEAKGYEHIW